MDKALDYTGAGNAFVGYEKLEAAAKIVAIYVDGTSVAALKEGQNGVVVLDATPFYAESGGQVGDEGVLTSGSARFAVPLKATLSLVFRLHALKESAVLKRKKQSAKLMRKR